MVTYLRPELVFKAISDDVRRTILDELRESPLTVNDLARRFTVSRPAISRHLRILLCARLVSQQRSGRHRVYQLNAAPLAEVDVWLQRYRLFWTARLLDLKDFVETRRRKK